ncbi:hypothetical protein CTI12_AA478570 [Artemisia annua]|uniref:Uncharacterized protein n=1 Tax=Artemisia annua TaxID=35608 RepID=A0A2U1LAH8_ARTAN|nr:hypothetical protein CTI12_AA478570 [Artemisia annua]
MCSQYFHLKIPLSFQVTSFPPSNGVELVLVVDLPGVGRFRMHSMRDEESKFKLCNVWFKRDSIHQHLYVIVAPSATEILSSKLMTQSSLTWRLKRLLISLSLMLGTLSWWLVDNLT